MTKGEKDTYELQISLPVKEIYSQEKAYSIEASVPHSKQAEYYENHIPYGRNFQRIPFYV